MKNRVVADTNVLISAAIAYGPPRHLVDRCVENKITLLVSQHILEEYVDVLNRPKLNLRAEEIQRHILAMNSTTEIVAVTSDVRVIHEDPADNKILATALDGRADYIVSGDSHLLDLEEFQGIPIMRVSEFLALHS